MRAIQRGPQALNGPEWPLGLTTTSAEGQCVYGWPQGRLVPSQKLLGSSLASSSEWGVQEGTQEVAEVAGPRPGGHGLLGPTDLVPCGGPRGQAWAALRLVARHPQADPISLGRRGSCLKTRGRRCGASGNSRSGCWRSGCVTCRSWRPWRPRPRPRVRMGAGSGPPGGSHRASCPLSTSACLPRLRLQT